jgi:16S rRNA (uracil1498-N3)-methyltransferase
MPGMRLHRFYIEQKIDGKEEIILTDSEILNQLGKVFRFKSGDRIIIFDGTGFEYEAEIILISKKECRLNILKSTQGSAFGNSKSPALGSRNVSLYLSLIKKDNFEWASEKCTEMGVTEIHPIISERSEKKDLNLERLNKIVKEASEQSGRVTLPQLFPIKPLDLAVSQAKNDGKQCIIFDPSGEKQKTVSQDNVAIFIGPEGGWSEVELNMFKENGFKIISMGNNILRAETAAIIGSSLFLIL